MSFFFAFQTQPRYKLDPVYPSTFLFYPSSVIFRDSPKLVIIYNSKTEIKRPCIYGNVISMKNIF